MAPRYPAVLVAHGSFNPVHRHHIEMMASARKCLEDAGFVVVRGILAITNSDRLAKKGADAVTDEHRLAALKLGCDTLSGNWLAPEPRGVEYGSGRQLAKGLAFELLEEEPDATIFTVVGADTALRYKGETKGPTVVVGREGSTKAVRKALQGVAPGRKWDLFVVEQLSGEECSSTKLRLALRENDRGAVRQICPAPVAEYLWLHRQELFGQCSVADSAAVSAVPADVPAAGTASCGSASMLPRLASVRPVPGPGQGMTPKLLSNRWASSRSTRVVEFYGHSPKMGDLACFSNFYDQTWCAFDFVLPLELDGVGLVEADRTTQCTYSEKAIMLCKAAMFGDSDSYMAIRKAHSPAKAKALGRSVQGFNENLWSAVVCSIAFEVVFQKFSKTRALQPMLLATGGKVIAEATRNDRNWGIGIDTGDLRCQNPTEWRGTNILGWALMEVRSALSCEGAGMQVSEPELIPGKVPCGAASLLTQSPSHPSATLREKKFLKHCKVVRDIWKLEDQRSRGDRLEPPQKRKLQKKVAALNNVRDALEHISGDSALKQKNQDVVQAAVNAI